MEGFDEFYRKDDSYLESESKRGQVNFLLCLLKSSEDNSHFLVLVSAARTTPIPALLISSI